MVSFLLGTGGYKAFEEVEHQSLKEGVLRGQSTFVKYCALSPENEQQNCNTGYETTEEAIIKRCPRVALLPDATVSVVTIVST